MEEFEKRVLNVINKYNLIQEKDKIVLGVSGGPDSIAMLESLYQIKTNNKIDFEICVAHINHGIRENAKIDEQFVLDFCKERNIECYVLHSKVLELAKDEKRGVEETGRKVRYEFFNEIMEKTNSNKIAIAHNKNDRAETIIMNTLRGSGISGLKGIEAARGKYIRPLIECERSEIETYCKRENINPRIDKTNFNNTYTRNKIRNVVIPYIQKEFNPNIINTLERLSQLVCEEEEYIEKQIIKTYMDLLIEEDVPNQIILDLKSFNKQEKVIKSRVLIYTINKLFNTSKGIEKIHIEDVIRLCENNIGNKYLTPNKKIKILVKNHKIYFLKQI